MKSSSQFSVPFLYDSPALFDTLIVPFFSNTQFSFEMPHLSHLSPTSCLSPSDLQIIGSFLNDLLFSRLNSLPIWFIYFYNFYYHPNVSISKFPSPDLTLNSRLVYSTASSTSSQKNLIGICCLILKTNFLFSTSHFLPWSSPTLKLAPSFTGYIRSNYGILLECFLSKTPYPIHQQILLALPFEYTWNLTMFHHFCYYHQIKATIISCLNYYYGLLTVLVL